MIIRSGGMMVPAALRPTLGSNLDPIIALTGAYDQTLPLYLERSETCLEREDLSKIWLAA